MAITTAPMNTWTNSLLNTITTSSTSTTSNWITVSDSTTSGYTMSREAMILAQKEAAFFALDDDSVRQYIHVSREFEYECPDGTVLKFKNGDVEVIDDNAKVVYKSNPIREFNPYLNASDLLEEFIGFCQDKKVRQDEFLKLPIELFIMWLVVKTAEQDGEDDVGAMLMLEDANKQRRLRTKCKCCGRFLPDRKIKQGINFCNGEHLDRFMQRDLIAA